jgi:hypothetical protein
MERVVKASRRKNGEGRRGEGETEKDEMEKGESNPDHTVDLPVISLNHTPKNLKPVTS